MIAYCVRCKAKKEMKNPKQVKMKNGRKAPPHCSFSTASRNSPLRGRSSNASRSAKGRWWIHHG